MSPEEAAAQRRAGRAEALLRRVAQVHHGTITPSRLHDPENQDWDVCPCLTCAAVARLLRSADSAVRDDLSAIGEAAQLNARCDRALAEAKLWGEIARETSADAARLRDALRYIAGLDVAGYDGHERPGDVARKALRFEGEAGR